MTESMIQNSFQRRGDQTSLNRATRFPAANNERSPTDGRSPQLTTLPTKSTSSTISVVDRRLSHLDTLASESIHVIREVVAVRRPHSSSPVARTSPCSCTWRRRRADPSASPRPCRSTRARSSPRSSTTGTKQVANLGARLVVGSVQEDIDRGSIVGQPVPGATRNGPRPTPC